MTNQTSGRSETAKVRFDLVPYARGRAIDIGCGNDKLFPTFLGVDNCLDNLLYRAQIQPDLIVETGEHLGLFTADTFDCTFSSHTLDRIENYQAALAEWFRITKPGGHLILYLADARVAPEGGRDVKHRFMPADILAAMREVGGWDLIENELRREDDEHSFLQVYRKRADGEQHDLSTRPRADKRLAVVRMGAFGDALWLTSALPHLKAQGYEITVYTQEAGELVLRHDPNVDRIIVMSDYLFTKINLVEFFVHQERQFDRFINLVGSVESRLLPNAKDFEFYWSDEVRRRVMNVNYLDVVHDWCGVSDAPRRVRFTPTADEYAQAQARRNEIDGPIVMLNPAGSGQYKWWPYAQAFLDLMAERGVHCFVVGDNAGAELVANPKFGHLVGRTWGMRAALAFAQLADVVVGPESALVNAVAHEPMLKVVMLSHSTETNLTRDWENTIPSVVSDLACYPCHRIHMDMSWCTQDKRTLASACMASMKPESIAEQVLAYIEWLEAQQPADVAEAA